MKANAIVRIVLFSIAIVILISILLGVLLVHEFAYNFDWSILSGEFSQVNEGTLASSGSVSADGIRDIEIEWAAGSVTLRPGDTDTITFFETDGLSEKDKMVWRQTGDKLVIHFSQTENYFGINIDRSKDLLITVPRDWVCDDLEINAASARVDITNMTINGVNFNGASGDCHFSNCHVGELDVDTASGNIRFTGTLESLDCDAASASCIIHVTNVPLRIEADMASGDLDLTLPEDCGFTVSLDALSGNFSSDFATTTQNGNYVHGDGSCRISVTAMSGDVTIRNANKSAS